MKSSLLILIVFLGMVSCRTSTSKDPISKDPNLKIEKVTGTVAHGMWKIQIDDSTTILLYRGVESCTMIQLK